VFTSIFFMKLPRRERLLRTRMHFSLALARDPLVLRLARDLCPAVLTLSLRLRAIAARLLNTMNTTNQSSSLLAVAAQLLRSFLSIKPWRSSCGLYLLTLIDNQTISHSEKPIPSPSTLMFVIWRRSHQRQRVLPLSTRSLRTSHVRSVDPTRHLQVSRCKPQRELSLQLNVHTENVKVMKYGWFKSVVL